MKSDLKNNKYSVYVVKDICYTAAQRRKYVDLATKNDCIVYLINMDFERDICQHFFSLRSANKKSGGVEQQERETLRAANETH